MRRVFWITLVLLMFVPSAAAQQPLYESEAFTVGPAEVRQDSFRAVAHSRTHLTSNYQRERTAINFKFSINRRDNERPSGDDHRLRLAPAGGQVTTPLLTFGSVENQGTPLPNRASARGTGDTFDVTFRLDMQHVHERFRETGWYDPPAGAPIAADDFEGVYIVGDTPPLTWDWDALSGSDRYRLNDPDGDGIYTITLTFEQRDLRPLDDAGRVVWQLQEDVSAFPQYRSDQLLVDVLYNLSLEELLLNIREDGAYMAGAKWTGVWTRDISYSILLSLALIDPEGARRSLMQKVTDDGRIIQDTGTGGSWPISSDRMTWALAAWEVYLTTGDRDWLREAHDIISRSVEADLKTVRDPQTGLFRGESSFLDWREQSYPDWMDPKDIYLSQNLGTNVVHYATYDLLAAMARELGDSPTRYDSVAQETARALDHYLWQDEVGYYGQFRYGRNAMQLSPRAEHLGEALAILRGVASAEQANRMAEQVPVVPYGVPSFYPYIPGIPPYHNNGIWPFVVSYWTWASAEAGNAAGVEHGLASIYRAAALFLTNKENMVAETGHFEGTQINSDRQLWSVAGNLAMVYRIFFGMDFRPDGLHLDPFIPAAYGGTRRLDGISYRGATLTIEIEGWGSGVTSITLDGQPLDGPVIPADLTGAHTIRITMNQQMPERSINLQSNRFAPPTPVLQRAGQTLTWTGSPDAEQYVVYERGAVADVTADTIVRASVPDALTEVQVQSKSDVHASFLSAPVRFVGGASTAILQPPDSLGLETEHAGFSGAGYLPITQTTHTEITLPVTVPEAGRYSIDVRYANGHGPINTNNKACIRTLRVDGERVGPLVMPQRGEGDWTDWGYSNPVQVDLEAGKHVLTVVFTSSDRNMNGVVNAAHVDHLRLTRLPSR